MISSAILITQILCLSYWIGGSFVLSIIVRPEILRPSDGVSIPLPTMTRILLRYNTGLLISALTLAGTLYVQLAFLSNSLGIKLRIALTLVMLGVLLAAYTRFALLARPVERDDQLPQGAGTLQPERIGNLQGRSYRALLANFLLGVAVVITLVVPLP